MYFGFEHITIGYGKKRVINDMTMEFPKGKIITIIGPNGSGKSSLLKTISKAVVPKSGKVLFGGRELKAIRRSCWRRKSGIWHRYILLRRILMCGHLFPTGDIPIPDLAGD